MTPQLLVVVTRHPPKSEGSPHLSWLSIGVTNMSGVKQHQEERVCVAYTSREVRAGTWRQTLRQSPGRGAALWLAPHGLLTLLFSYAPRPPTAVWPLPYQS